MQLRLNVWWLLIVLAGIFSILYLWFTLFPGKVSSGALQYFDIVQINRGRDYNMARRLVFISSFIVQSALLLWLVLGGRAVSLSNWARDFAGGNYWGSILLFFVTLWLILQLVNLPFLFFSSYYWQHQWGFSTQSLWSWWADYLKGSGLELTLSSLGVILFFWITGRWPRTWWLAGTIFFSAWLLIQSYLWPVVVSPLFNRFVPAKDPAIISMVRDLSQKANLPVDQVLIMDASKRTTMANAYFTGLGSTKRIVIYDTLLENYPMDQVKAVLAHEMGHWVRGHINRGLAMGIAGALLLWSLLFMLLKGMNSSGPFPPHILAVALLFLMLASFVTTPLQNYISRGMEREADRASVVLTGDVGAAVRLEVDLAVKNLSDVSPPPFIEWYSYSHPPAPERIAIIKGTSSR
ncbi:MAG: M48 family metallopeptidase [Desulfocucumaceae bacterium]